jgi:hypothetical protein
MNVKHKIDGHFHEAIEIIKPYVEKFSEEKNLEIEFRLGYMEDDEFKTDIKRDYFDKIYNVLSSTDVWSDVKEEKTEDYFYNTKRLTIGLDQEICVKKEKLVILDFALIGSGFDVRVSFSRETPVKKFDITSANYLRKKDRTSFIHKHVSFDLTDVSMVDNSIENHLYEVELEIKELDLAKMSSYYMVHDALLKITDMVKMCEELDDNHKLEFTKDKIY